MANGPITEAFVQITPDFSKFDGKLQQGIARALADVGSTAQRAFDSIESTAANAADAVGRAFDHGASQAEAALQGLSGAAFTAVEGDAEAAATGIATSFDDAATQAADALATVSDAGFSGIDDAASTAADGVATAFDDAATSAGAALDGITGSGLANVDTEAAAAADTLSTSFDSAASDAQAALDSIDTGALTGQIDAATTSMEDFSAAADSAAGAAGGAGGTASTAASEFDAIGGAAAGAAIGVGDSALSIGELAKAGAEFLGVREIVTVLKDSADAAQQAAATGRVLEQIIETTGGAAGITADAIEKMAQGQSQALGVNKLQIEQADALLLTFNKVRDAGPGADAIFDRASKTALDLATVLNIDVGGATKQLGKALQDPAKGLTALTRLGIRFTQQQQDQVKALVASGDALSAQKIILDAIGGRFGGAAAAAADPLKQLSATADILLETLGKFLLNGLEPLAQEFIKLTPVLEPVAVQIGTSLASALSLIAPLLPKIVEEFAKLLVAILPLIPVMTELVIQLLEPLLPIIPPIVQALVDFATGLTIVLQVLEPFLRVFNLFFTGILVGGDAVISFFAHLIDSLGGFSGILGDIEGFFSGLLDSFTSFASDAGPAVLDFFTSLPGKIEDALGPIADTIGGALLTAGTKVVDFFTALPGEIARLLVTLGETLLKAFAAAIVFVVTKLPLLLVQITGFFIVLPLLIAEALAKLSVVLVDEFVESIQAVVDILPGVAAAILDFFTALPGQIIDAVTTLGPELLSVFVDATSAVMEVVVGFGADVLDFFTSLPGRIIDGLSVLGPELFDLFTSAMSGAASAFADGIGNIVSEITGFIGNLPGYAADVFNGMVDFGRSILDGLLHGVEAVGGFLADAANAVLDAIEKIIHSIVHALDKGLSFHISLPVVGKIGFDSHLENLLPFAEGGIFDTATAALIGEAGREVLIPLTDPKRALELVQQSGLLDVLQKASNFATSTAATATAGITAAPSGGQGVQIIVADGAVRILFANTPTDSEAQRVGEQVAAGLTRSLAERQALASVRTLAPTG